MRAWQVKTKRTKRATAFPVGGLGVVRPSRARYGEAVTPYWLAVATEEGAARAVFANLLMGNALVLGDGCSSADEVAIPRSVPSTRLAQRFPDERHEILTLYTNGVCDADPGPRTGTEEAFTFLVLPDKGWRERSGVEAAAALDALDAAEAVGLPISEGEEELADPDSLDRWDRWDREWRARNRKDLAAKRLARSAPLAALDAVDQTALALLFVSYVNARTRCPLLASAGFALTLLYRALNAGLAVALDGEEGRVEGVEWVMDARLGYGLPVLFAASAPALEKLLAETVAAYVQAVR